MSKETIVLALRAPTNESEFRAMMSQVDHALALEGIEPFARPLKAALRISSALGLGLRLLSPELRIVEGDYSGDSLSARIQAWYDLKYGKRLETDARPGSVAVSIGDDTWRLWIPRMYGTVAFVLDPTMTHREPRLVPRPGEPHLTLNILDCVEDLTSVRAAMLSKAQQEHLMRFFRLAVDVVTIVDALPQKYSLPIAREDFRASVNELFAHGYVTSWYHSSQFVEKLFKALLETKGVEYPREGAEGHNIVALGRLIQANYPVVFNRNTLDQIYCPDAARYGEMSALKNHALLAHQGSLVVVSALCARRRENR